MNWFFDSELAFLLFITAFAFQDIHIASVSDWRSWNLFWISATSVLGKAATTSSCLISSYLFLFRLVEKKNSEKCLNMAVTDSRIYQEKKNNNTTRIEDGEGCERFCFTLYFFSYY